DEQRDESNNRTDAENDDEVDAAARHRDTFRFRGSEGAPGQPPDHAADDHRADAVEQQRANLAVEERIGGGSKKYIYGDAETRCRVTQGDTRTHQLVR